jgi:hypothetical protein
LEIIDPAKGWVKGNVIVVSHFAKRIKSDATPEELLRVADWLEATRAKAEPPAAAPSPVPVAT